MWINRFIALSSLKSPLYSEVFLERVFLDEEKLARSSGVLGKRFRRALRRACFVASLVLARYTHPSFAQTWARDNFGCQ